jgi:hypothetical protein|tara:strand:- start:793 stop:1224 length:432 start_codon:yes stop_codon:yes gene_type:complete
MVNPMIIILGIGVLSAVFGILLIFAPNLVLKAERQANRLFMTDTALINNRIPLGLAMLVASAFLGYTYVADPFKEVIFLVIAITAGVFGVLLLVSPDTILQAEKHANKLYMTDAFFFKHRVVIGACLLAASAFMVRTYLVFAT